MQSAPGSDSGHISFLILMKLIDALIAKDIITAAEINALLAAIAEDEGKSRYASGQRAAPFLRKLAKSKFK